MGTVLLLISAIVSPFLILLSIHYFAKYRLTSKMLNDEKIKMQKLTEKIQKIETESNSLKNDVRSLKSASPPKWTTDPKKMTHDQLERCVNYFVENYNKVKN